MEKKNVLENLDPDKREWILEMATHMPRLSDMMEPLMSNGIEVSLSTLTRFVRRHKEGMLLSEGEDMRETVETLAKRGRGETFRKGTLEALRQRLYDQALLTNDPEQTQKLFGELLKEEAKLKEMELAERKMLLAEQQAKLERVRLRIELRQRLNGHERTSAQLRDRQRAHRGKGTVEIEAIVAEDAKLAVETKSGERLLTGGNRENGEDHASEKLAQVREILNRGGRAEEKVLEARAALAVRGIIDD